MSRAVIKFVFVLICMCSPALAMDSTMFMQSLTLPIVQQRVVIDSLTYEELRSIYMLGITHWKNGQHITVILMSPNNPLQRRFLWEYFGITAARYREIINAKIANGKTSPIIVDTDMLMLSMVGSTPGSIGFIGNNIYVNGIRNIKPLRIY